MEGYGQCSGELLGGECFAVVKIRCSLSNIQQRRVRTMTSYQSIEALEGL